jgi:methylase of polypeptide subunit release factors
MRFRSVSCSGVNRVSLWRICSRQRGFWTLDLVSQSSHTLIPRPETEMLVEFALEKLLANSVERQCWTWGRAVVPSHWP